MSGINNKSSKIDRILARITDIGLAQFNIDEVIRVMFRQQATVEKLTADNALLSETVLRQQNTIELLSKTTHRQDAELVSKSRQLGLALAKLNERKPSAFDRTFPFLSIPTLEPNWGNHANDKLPHTGTKTV